MTEDESTEEEEEEENTITNNPPLAQYCSLCGDGYHPSLEIEVNDEPFELNDGSSEYRWVHKQCKRDHGRIFLRATPDDGWDIPG